MGDFNTNEDILNSMPEHARKGQYNSWERFNKRTVEDRIRICEDEVEMFSAVNNAFLRTVVLTLIELYTEKIHKDHC